MRRSLLFLVLAAGVGLAALAGPAAAGRVPSRKVVTLPSVGARPDITVPFLTNGRSTLGVANGVAPIIVHHPGLGTRNDAQVRPVYNLIYYGSRKSPNDTFMGAIPRPPNRLRPNR